MFEAHSDYIRSIIVHPTQPYVLTSSGKWSFVIYITINMWNQISFFLLLLQQQLGFVISLLRQVLFTLQFLRTSTGAGENMWLYIFAKLFIQALYVCHMRVRVCKTLIVCYIGPSLHKLGVCITTDTVCSKNFQDLFRLGYKRYCIDGNFFGEGLWQIWQSFIHQLLITSEKSIEDGLKFDKVYFAICYLVV